MLNSEYLNNLNENQKEATLHLDGPLLIVAGAGSGKTRVLTSRIAHIIKQHKAFPNQILAVTFTNKAAKEMQYRVSKILRSGATGLSWLGTFHSICAKILRKHASAINLNSNFTSINVQHHKRQFGLGNYSLFKSISLWLRVLTNFSVIPLRISTIVGLFSALIGFCLGIYFIVLHFYGVVEPEGWRSLFVSILFIGGIQLMGIGVIGEYVGRSFLYQSKEPQFIIKEVHKRN